MPKLSQEAISGNALKESVKSFSLMLITRDFKLPVPGKKVYSYLRETAEKKLIDSMDQSALVQEFSKSFDSERATIRRRRT